MDTRRETRGRRRGAALVLAAFGLVTLGTVGALAIDLAMLYRARGDAQRAAEAAALAGASAFVDYAVVDPVVTDSADTRARGYAESNAILNQAVLPAEVQDVQVVLDSQKVRVTVARPKIGTWFARLIGVDSVAIGASAAAVAEHAGNGKCVKPFAVPDTWDEGAQDANGDNLENGGEAWSYTPGDDTYAPGNPDEPLVGSGYGSALRGTDYGRQVGLILPDGVTPITGPNQFRPFSADRVTPYNAAEYRQAIETCDQNDVNFTESYPLISGQPTAETQEGVQALIDMDPPAVWDPVTQTIQNSDYPDWRASPRVVKIGLFDPGQLGPAQTEVTFNNLGMMFLEKFEDDPVTGLPTLTGRIFYFSSGTGDPEDDLHGTLVKRLRLVE
jgi:Putative Flp pilus-assembly TadE/G-like